MQNSNYAMSIQSLSILTLQRPLSTKKSCILHPLSANPTKWSNARWRWSKLPTNCLSVFDHFVGLTLKGLNKLHCNPLTHFMSLAEGVQKETSSIKWVRKCYEDLLQKRDYFKDL